MKKLLAFLTALTMVMLLSSCKKISTGSPDTTTQTYKIGICNYTDDASLNQIVENIEARLNAISKEKQVVFDIQTENSNADPNVMSQIITNFIADEVALMIGVATPVAIQMQTATQDNQIPVVFSAVSDPLDVQLVSSLESPGENITGTSDYLNTEAVMELIFAANKDAKKIALLYDNGQDSSQKPIEKAREFLDKKGISYKEYTGTNIEELKLAADAIVADKADAVFTPTDNTVMTAELSIYETFAKAGIPHYAGADSFALNGAFVGYGVDYTELGIETADMAADILLNGKSPATLPVKTFDNGTATINTEICSAIGYDFEKIKTAFEPYCTKIETITTAESF